MIPELPRPGYIRHMLLLGLTLWAGSRGLVLAQSPWPADTVIMTLPDCDGSAVLCLEALTPEQVPDYQLQLDGQAWPEGLQVCDYDTLSIYFYGLLFGQGVLGPYRLDAWPVDNDTYSGLFPTISALVDSMNTWDPLGNWELQPANFTITGGSKGRNYGTMAVTALVINSPAQIGYNFSLQAAAWGIRVAKGRYPLTLRHLPTNATFDALVVAGCTSAALEALVMVPGESRNFCLPDSLLPGDIVHLQGDTLPGSPALLAWDPATGCLEVTARFPGSQSWTLVWTDAFGFSFTLDLHVQVMVPEGATVVPVSIYAGETLLYCPDSAGLPGMLVSVQDACPMSGLPAFGMAPIGLCFRITGLTPADTAYACLLRCDDTGFCDTIYLQVTVLFHLQRQDSASALIRFQRWWCPDVTAFAGSPLTLAESCPPTSGILDYSLDPLGPCVSFTGLASGTDTLCLELQDTLGNRVSMTLAITITLPRQDSMSIEMPPGEVRTICLDTAELAGSLKSLGESCGGLPSWAEITVTDLPCLEIRALSPGQGLTCLVLCDEYGTCDTTFLWLDVRAPSLEEPPLARNDTVSGLPGQTLVIPVLLNDDFSAQHPQFSMSLLQGPLHGLAVLNADGTVTYRSEADFCGEDMFRYRICHGMECAVAVVIILVLCEEDGRLEVFSGFSPNGDGINDFFTIRGIEESPGSHLRVFNRWGNLVLDRVGYQNNWDGTWNGTILPDGTYYYILSRPNGPVQSGWVQLWR